jgi:hypothetical protein
MLYKYNIAESLTCTKLAGVGFETIARTSCHLVNSGLRFDSGFGDEGIMALLKRNEGY